MKILFAFICLGVLSAPSLTYDRKERHDPLPHFRTAQDPFKRTHPTTSREGLDQLRVSASGQPSIQEIEALKTSFERLILVDLRKESHGFLNGEPVSWGKKEKGEKSPFVYYVSDRVGRTYPILKQEFIMEKNVAAQLGIESRSFATKNHTPPSEEVLNSFIAFVRGLEPGTWVHLHCKEGCGRATTYMILFDMLHNADKVSFEEIVYRHYLLGGANIAKHERYERLLRFLEAFYQKINATTTSISESLLFDDVRQTVQHECKLLGAREKSVKKLMGEW